MKVKLDRDAYMPERAHPTDAGLDLRTPIGIGVSAGGCCTIDTGVHIEIIPGCFGKIESKSGLNVKYGIVACGGVIDEGYTGSIVVKLYNLSGKPYWFDKGDKIAQLIIIPCITPDMELVDKLDDTPRGDGGFGSTGK